MVLAPCKLKQIREMIIWRFAVICGFYAEIVEIVLSVDFWSETWYYNIGIIAKQVLNKYG